MVDSVITWECAMSSVLKFKSQLNGMMCWASWKRSHLFACTLFRKAMRAIQDTKIFPRERHAAVANDPWQGSAGKCFKMEGWAQDHKAHCFANAPWPWRSPLQQEAQLLLIACTETALFLQWTTAVVCAARVLPTAMPGELFKWTP